MWTLLPCAYGNITHCALRRETYHWKYENGVYSPALRKRSATLWHNITLSFEKLQTLFQSGFSPPCSGLHYQQNMHASFMLTSSSQLWELDSHKNPKWERNCNECRASYCITLVSSSHVYASKVWHCFLHTIATFFLLFMLWRMLL